MRHSIWTIAAVLVLLAAVGRGEDVSSLKRQGKAFAAIAKKAVPAVVFIQCERTVVASAGAEQPMFFNDPFELFNDEFFRRFFHRPVPRQKFKQVSQGSGFIITKDGYILTNNHVVGDADKITVKLLDGRSFAARRVGTDPHTDVAVIKIDGKDLPVLPMGDSDKIEVGEWVMAIGNPFGLAHTVTVGIVSAKGRSSVGIVDYEDFIQTDAAINPGNSGGPLINMDGEAIGINTAIFSRSGGYMGIGFAIPINIAKKIYRQMLKNNGKVVRGFLGVVVQNMTPDMAKAFGVTNEGGILVAQVMKDSPAYRAGLKRGDVILELNGKPVKDVASFRNTVALSPPGTEVSLTVLRKGRRIEVKATLGELGEGGFVAGGDLLRRLYEKVGIRVDDLTPPLARRFGYGADVAGVVITDVAAGSAAAVAGIRPGMLLVELDRREVHSVKDLRKILPSALKKDRLLLLVGDGDFYRYVMIHLK